jgi:WS/DGAT/MGAT family acyltransferase
MYIIEGLDNIEGYPPNCFGLLLKVHHCAMDGATGAQFMNIVHDLTPETRDVGKAPPWIVQRPSRARMLGQAYVDAWRKPGQVLDMAKQAVPAYRRIREGQKEEQFHSLEDKQKTRFQGRISPHRVVDACKFDFEEVRAIKNSHPGATINDAMLAIVSGGLRKYLEAKGELPDKTLVTGCPIDVRAAEEREAGGNMVGFMNVSLCSDIADPAKRMAAISKASKESKAFAEALGPRVPIDLADVMPGNVLSLAMRAASATGLSEANVIHNTIITNVPGPPIQLYMCGAALVDAISLGPLLPNVGLFHIVYSSVQNKKGSINLSFTADRDMMPDPAFYAQCLRESYQELRATTVGSGSKAKSRAKPKTRAKAKTTPKQKAKAKANPKAKAKAGAKAKAIPRAKAKAKPKAKAKAKPGTKTARRKK